MVCFLLSPLLPFPFPSPVPFPLVEEEFPVVVAEAWPPAVAVAAAAVVPAGPVEEEVDDDSSFPPASIFQPAPPSQQLWLKCSHQTLPPSLGQVVTSM